MAKKFLIFTSICTVICTILALIVAPFAVEDLAVIASEYYESTRGIYDKEFIEDTNNAKRLYISNRSNNLTIKKSTDNKIKYSWKNDLREVNLMTSKINDTLIFQIERNYQYGINVFSRENVLRELAIGFYYDYDSVLTELYVPDGIEVVLSNQPRGTFYVEEGINCRIKYDDEDMFNRPVKEPNAQELPEFEDYSSEVSPLAPEVLVVDTAFITNTKAKLVEINNGYTKLYSNYKASVIDRIALENGLNQYITSEMDLLTTLMNGNRNIEKHISDAREYANITTNINISNIAAKALLEEYTAGTIQKPEYYNRDILIYEEIAQLEESKQLEIDLKVELDQLYSKYQITFPFAQIID